MEDKNIFVEFDYQNIVLVDPNKVVDKDGNISERQVNHENLVAYANLECELTNRTRLSRGNDTANAKTISIASLNFLKPKNGDSFTTNYYDEMTGEGSVNKTGQNQKFSSTDVNNRGVNKEDYLVDSNNVIDNELLGITQINIENTTAGLPEVMMELEDVQGRALFQLGENSPYATFFNFPYPIFYLTIKGYYGSAVRYQLALRTFNTRFDTLTGNFKISLKFFAYKFNVLSSLTMDTLRAVPYMYERYLTSTPDSDDGLSETVPIRTSLGYEKIKEVYSDYKSRGLLPLDFPEITFNDLMVKLENIETIINNSFNLVDLTPLNDLDNYKEAIDLYVGRVVNYSNSWVNRFLNTTNSDGIILTDGSRLYPLKLGDNISESVADKDLQFLIDDSEEILRQNPTFGDGGKYIFKTLKKENGSSELSTSINIGITLDIFKIKKIMSNDINYEETQKLTGLNTNQINATVSINYLEGVPYYRVSGNDNCFIDRIGKIKNILKIYAQDIENDLSVAITEQVSTTSENGLGFAPTLRNVLAVIMANAEAFLRLMGYVHELAWEKRQDDNRIASVLTPFNKVENPTDTRSSSEEQFVYPWPQYFVEKDGVNGKSYDLEYPGKIESLGYNVRDVWPEVDFVEEYLAGTLKLKDDKNGIGFDRNEFRLVNVASLLSLDFPVSPRIYQNKQEVKYLYEIYERLYGLLTYSELNYDEIISNLSDIEAINIISSLSNNSPYLSKKLKNFKIDNLLGYLRLISNDGLGESWQTYIRGGTVTPYLRNEIEENTKIIEENKVSANIGVSIVSSNKLFEGDGSNSLTIEGFLNRKSHNFDSRFTNTLPYNVSDIGTRLLANGNNESNSWFSSNKVLKVNKTHKVISNFDDNTTKLQVRPYTSFDFLTENQIPSQDSLNNLNAFYSRDKYYLTEGVLNYDDHNGNLSDSQTTSILNTPMFINAITQGVRNEELNQSAPYKEAAFLFLNSLPISTLREKYISNGSGDVEYLDYIATTLKKFGGIHKLPYAFLLRIGSIWHRYKTWIEDEVDILDSVWVDFDEVNNFDPVTTNSTKEYSITFENGVDEIITLSGNNNNVYYQGLGFYPKLINDFTYFFTGSYWVSPSASGYTNDVIQSTINNTLTLKKNNETSFRVQGYRGGTLKVDTYYSLFVDNFDNVQYPMPSFGCVVNQSQDECFLGNIETHNYIDNKSVTNGSINLFWGAPNYGYFDIASIVKPTPKQHFKLIDNTKNKQLPFLLGSSDYSDIEEIFSVFDKDTLDKLELEFLNFSQSSKRYEILSSEDNIITADQITINQFSNDIYRNFQNLIRETFALDKGIGDLDSIRSGLMNSVNLTLQKFLEYDVVFKFGNPSYYDKRLFWSFNPNKEITDRLEYSLYVDGNLPGESGVTLLQSRARNPETWKTLETYVGFSDMPGFTYSDDGSYITDFFIDMNVEFTEVNVRNLAPIIKIFVKQKGLNPSLTRDGFFELLSNYESDKDQRAINLSNEVIRLLNSRLPKVSENVSTPKRSELQGEQLKLTTWERFKALNDTWISGNDYSQTTLFEDVLLMDRANRNIGDYVFIDPFKTRRLLKSVNPDASVYHYVSSLIVEHKFFVQMMPAYINFYNVQNIGRSSRPLPENTLDFANSLFGTFLNVDTRESSPKLLCTYIGPSSKYPADINTTQRRSYGDDAFDLGSTADVPLIDNLIDKEDWNLSNKVVGFNVDIGIKHQNIFYYFDVSQDIGKQTTESIYQTHYMIEQNSGKQIATQNNSLWDLYLNRSYSCTVRSLGNAMIQPAMYFNLRHVPMFRGPYYILNVKHTISPGTFETIFEGIRQPIYSLPRITDFIQSMRKNLFDQIRDKIYQIKRSDCDLDASGTTQVNNTSVDTEKCRCNLNKKYSLYQNITANQTNVSSGEVVLDLNSRYPGDRLKFLRYIIFYSMYLKTYNKDRFLGKNYNFAKLPLTVSWGGSLSGLFSNVYICIDDYPYISFDSKFEFYSFLDTILREYLIEGLEVNNENIVNSYVSLIGSKINEKSNADLLEKADKSIEIAKRLGL